MPPSSELRVAIRLTGVDKLRAVRDQLRQILNDAKQANQELQRLQRTMQRTVGATGRGGAAAARTGTTTGVGSPAFLATLGGQDLSRQRALISNSRELSRMTRGLSGEFLQLGRSANSAFGLNSPLQAGLEKGTRAMPRLTSQTKSFNKEVARSERLLKLTQAVLEVFLLYRGFVFLQTQASEFVRTLVDLEFRVAQVQTQLNELGALDFQFEIARNVRRAASETGQALDSLAETQFDIVSANVRLNESFEVLDAVARAGAAGGLTDMRVAFNAAITQANAFGIAVDRTDEILDKQFQALRRGIFTYEQFVQVSGRVSTAFASIGQDVETANAALAAVSQVFTGPQLQFGATGLRNLAGAIGQNSEALREIGVEVFDTEGNFRNFLDIMQDINDVVEDMSEEEKFRVLREIAPDRREFRGLIALLENLDDFEQFLVEQRFAAGSVDRAFATMNETMRVQANILKTDLLPAGEAFAGGLGNIVGLINELNDTLPGTTAGLFTFGTAAGLAFGAKAFAPGVFAPRAGRLQGPLQPGAAGLVGGAGFGIRRGLGRVSPGGVGLSALFALQGFSVGQQPDTGPGQALGTIAGGAAIGAMTGGAPGALLGAAISGAALALGEAFEKDAPEVASSFSEAFKAALEEDAGDISTALVEGLLGAERIGGGGSIIEVTSQLLAGPDVQENVERGVGAFFDNLVQAGVQGAQRIRAGPGGGLFLAPQEPLDARGIGGRAVGQAEFSLFTEAVRAGREQQEATADAISELPAALQEQLSDAPALAIEKVLEEQFAIAGDAGLPGEVAKQLRDLATFAIESSASIGTIDQLFEQLANQTEPLISRREQLLNTLKEENLTSVERAEVGKELATVEGDIEELFLAFIRGLTEATDELDALGKATAEFRAVQSQFVGPFDDLAQLFEGSDNPLAPIFGDLAGIVEREAIVQQLGALGVEGERGGRPLRDALAAIETELTVEAEGVRQAFAEVAEGLSTSELRSIIDDLLKEAGEVTQELVEFQELTDVNIDLLANFFSQAADAVKKGLVDEPQRFGESLSTLAGKFEELQRRLEVVTILQQLQALTELAGIGGFQGEVLQGAIQLAAGQALGSLGGVAGGAFEALGVPEMAQGGLVTKPTFALIGEAGPEVVIPLKNIKGFADGTGSTLGISDFRALEAASLRTAQSQPTNVLFQPLQRPSTTTSTFSQPSSVFTDVRQTLGLQPRDSSTQVRRERQEFRNAQRREAARAVGGGGGVSAASSALVKAIMDLLSAFDETTETTEKLVIPGMTFLDESFREAADLVAQGLVPSMGFGVDQLTRFSDDLTAVNKVIRTAQIVEEFGRLGNLVGAGVDVTATIQEVLSEIQTVGGETIRDLLEDPKRLAEFLADIEFSDVNVDNSTNNNFVIRISAGVGEDAANLARIADKLVVEINKRTRSQVA